MAIVRPWAGFRMVLDGEGWQVPMAQTLDRSVVQVHVGELEARVPEERGIDGKAVVLGGDRHLSRLLVTDRMIRSTVSELELEGRSPARQPHDLVTEADSESGPQRHELAGRFHGVGAGLRIPGP